MAQQVQLPSPERLILQELGLSYAITDRELVVLEVSGDAPYLDRPASGSIGQALLDLAPELIGSEALIDAVLAGELPCFSIPMINSEVADSGEVVYTNLIELPYRAPSGVITGLIHVAQDVSEAGRLEQRVMQHRNELRLLQETLRKQNERLGAANAELHRMNEVKSGFVSVAAHELRTPLTSIAGYLELLEDGDAGPLNARQAEYLGIMSDSTRRLLRLTRDLLDITRIEAGRLELTLQPVDLVSVVREVVAEQTPQLEQRSQRLVLDARPDLPAALCDPARAAQIAGNLLSNASKFSPAGSEVRVAVSVSDGDPGLLVLAVTDQGAGIDTGDQARLFRPFFRAGSATVTGASGSGLGLYIVRSLTELHGGTVTFRSAPGLGSTFLVTLPVAGRAHTHAKSQVSPAT